MERNYSNNEEAINVAKEAVYIAWKACGHSTGMGVFQERGEQSKDAVWEQGYNQRDYAMRHGSPQEVHCDYVFGRMMKLDFTIKDKTIKHDDYEPRRDYQAWCGKYPSYAALFDAAETAVFQQAA